NQGANTWFLNDVSMGTALVIASDHLPIYADFSFGVSTNVDRYNTLPEKFELEQNYPNPFNPSTVISYKLQAASRVTLKVYDVLGREVAALVDEFKQPGIYNSQFSILNSQLSSGVYFYRLTTPTNTTTKKMVLTK
ncbi:MAG: T9SS type A sorting domain-containing protein, partial [Bacteroidota bacterium]